MAEAGIKYSQHAIAWLVQLVRSVVWGQQQAASSSSSVSAPPATPAAPQGWNASAQNIASSIMNMVSGATVTQAAASRWSSSAPKLSSSLSREQKLNELYAMIEELKNAPPTPTGSAASSSSTARPYKVGPDASGDEDDFEKVNAPANAANAAPPTTPTSNSTWTSWLWRTPPPQGEKSLDAKGRSKEKVL